MLRRLTLMLLFAPQLALAHGTPPIRFVSPVGPAAQVERGAPYVVSWHDPDLYPDDLLELHARPTSPPPYITFWPTERIDGAPVAPVVTMEDPVNALTVDTAGLAPGPWFFWFSVRDAGGDKYVAPAGVLTVLEPGVPPAPTIWLHEPATSTGASGEAFDAVWSTWPTDGVTVTLEASVDDLEGLALAPIADDLAGGTQVRHTVELRCVPDGAIGLRATVRDAAGRTGSAWATGRVSLHRPPGTTLPADCAQPPAPAAPSGGGDEGSGCSTTSDGATSLLALLPLALLRRRP